MAKKSSGSSSGESSNTGLIVTLIFFILATIALGVTTYMGYSGQAEAQKEAKAAADKETAEKGKARKEEAQRLALKIAAGTDEAADRTAYAAVKNEAMPQISEQIKAFYAALAGKVNSKDVAITPWDPSKGDEPPMSLVKIAGALQNAAAKAQTDTENVRTQMTGEIKNIKDALDSANTKALKLQETSDKHQKDLVAEQNTRAAGSDKKDEDIKRLSEDLQKLTIDKQNMENEKDAEIKKLRTQVDTSRKVRDQLREKVGPLLEKLDAVRLSRPELREVGELYDMLSRALEGPSNLVNDTPKGSILQLRNNHVYINLGSADSVRPGLSFSVLPSGSTGKSAAARERKGAIEVVTVLEPHLSACKILEVTNPLRDPLLSGDLLFNPAWNPSQREHVAIAGIIDLNGDGVDDAPDLIRALEKQGIAVDAWLDLKNRQIVGPGITERTTYLILGERPTLPPNMPVEGNPIATAMVGALGKITEMENKSRDLGVMKVPYRRFLSMIGYKLPKHPGAADASASSYLRGASGIKPTDSSDKPK